MTDKYKDALACFCRQSARLQFISENRQGFPKNLLARELNLLEDAKIALLREKKVLGYTDELSFLGDAVFQGFYLKDGAFVGDYEKAKLVSDAFLLEEDRDETHFRYEVGVLLHFHSRAARGDDLGLPALTKEELKGYRVQIRQKRMRRFITLMERMRIWIVIRKRHRLEKKLRKEMSPSVLQSGVLLF